MTHDPKGASASGPGFRPSDHAAARHGGSRFNPSREVFLVELSISSFRGSIGAEHYYGRFKVQTKSELVKKPDGSTSSVYRAGYAAARHSCDGHNIERVLEAKEAAYLSKKDGEGFVTRSRLHKAGDLTNRWNDKPSLVAAAIAEFPRAFGGGDLLVIEEQLGSGVYVGLAGPLATLEFLAAHPDYVEQYRYLAAAGYLHRDSDGNPKGEDGTASSRSDDSAGPQGIAHPQSGDTQ